eukprot:TRINITY_DN2030_c0_g1_i2.p1 TRINITY_DN2030_c0_g1~~TRINITY_DN2030_c0_g1_i2.p1  ORF type:complete len:382 (+),score=85.51 TRINITY_DN2030_c0_g1_i2:1151-2296(+)
MYKLSKEIVKHASSVFGLGKDTQLLAELLTSPSEKVLRKWFESEPLLGVLASDSCIGAMTSPKLSSSGYLLLHQVMGQIDDEKGVWAYVEGGMGKISELLAERAKSKGVKIYTSAEVENILDNGTSVQGVRLKGGTSVTTNTVISNATVFETMRLFNDSSIFPDSFKNDVSRIDYSSPVVKINLALSGLPNFRAYPNTHDGKPGPQHFGTIHINTRIQDLEDAYNQAKINLVSDRPMIEMTIPSSVDPTLAPKGKHVCGLFIQYASYNLNWTPDVKRKFANNVYNIIENYAPGFRKLILHEDILSPRDLEEVFSLTGGNIYHGAMTTDQLLWLRPSPKYCGYKLPLEGLYLCGAGAHPGGGVIGASGRNSARVILQDKMLV